MKFIIERKKLDQLQINESEISRYSPQEQKLLENLLNSELGRPQIDEETGMDWSLMTFSELKMFFQ